ncbi:MAG: hypothetical protein WDM96_05985 [Lacunisphaera sp.]
MIMLGLVAQRLSRERALDGVLRVFQAAADRVLALFLADRRRAPIGLEGVGQQVRVRNVAPAAHVFRQVEDVPLLREPAFEEKIQLPHLLQFGALSEHHRPGEDAEHGEQGDDRLTDDIRREKNLPDVDGGEEDGRREEAGTCARSVGAFAQRNQRKFEGFRAPFRRPMQGLSPERTQSARECYKPWYSHPQISPS